MAMVLALRCAVALLTVHVAAACPFAATSGRPCLSLATRPRLPSAAAPSTENPGRRQHPRTMSSHEG